ncbi:MAG TPA: sugar ABC transporter ATP-binding protein [Thermotogota bacterium]|nr:sugar ABC transporter ATP-binding protein [Thermotogota bacterium]HPJ89540.1 sugar ABC transporter ATP-binding protein [Thermotogota bacterium]HPR96625.1 sugar ABC transporter ATP-binding protein [Thermotogota bacterium]
MGGDILRIEGISKEFSKVRVLNNVQLDIEKGEVVGIIGENGAGKSTLIKIISGIYTPTEGELYFEGKRIEEFNPLNARKLGISLIPQEFNLIGELTVFENIFLGKEYRKKVLLNKRRMIERTKELLAELHTQIDPTEKIQNLSVAQKQMVEIAKSLAYDSKFLIMDEPTTVLTGSEIEVLFKIMNKLKERGVTIIYISHKLKEIKTICDRVMVLRDGEQIVVEAIENVDEHRMATLMVGRELSQIFPPKLNIADEKVLEVENISVRGKLKDISFDLRKGEILGFAGLVGAGRTEMAETLIGIRKKSSGAVRINGKEVTIRNPGDSIRKKLAYLSEDRQGTGIITSFDIIENITLSSLPEYARILIDHKKERAAAQYYVDSFKIKAASLQTALEFFSGGNQQKVSLAKSLDTKPEILIVDEPTRGIDVNAKREIYYFLNELAQKGISCIFISSELEEIIGMCSRVVVMKEGKITGILQGNDINEEEIMLHATGLKGVA